MYRRRRQNVKMIRRKGKTRYKVGDKECNSKGTEGVDEVAGNEGKCKEGLRNMWRKTAEEPGA